MTEFTPAHAAIGGLLIGIAAVLLMAATGRIAGVGGFLSRLLPPHEDRDWPLRLAFLAGIAAAPWLYQLATGSLVELAATDDTAVLTAAGLLVGCGAVLGSGCTSGHGICGVARLSPRSVVATGTFMATGILTVLVTRHLMGA